HAIVHRFLGRHEEVAVRVFGDLSHIAAGVLCDDLVEHLTGAKDFASLNLDVGDLSAHTAVGLVEHDAGVGQAVTLPLGSAGEKDGGAGSSLTNAVGRHVAGEHLHRVVHREGRDDVATG